MRSEPVDSTPPTPPARGRFRGPVAAAELLLLLLGCVLALGPGLLSPGQDALGHATRDLFDHLALLDAWALTAPHQGFPDGGSLFPPDLTGMALAALPLAAGLPRATAWNWMVLLQLWLACAGAWALGRRYGAGLVAGVTYGLSPYLLGQSQGGEAETLAAWPLPVMALCLEEAADRWRGRAVGSPRGWLVGAGLAGACAALGAWYHGAFAATYMGAWLLLRTRGLDGRRERRALLAPLAFAVAIAGPALVYVGSLRAPDQLFRGPAMADYLALYPRSLSNMVADPAAFFGPATAGVGHVDSIGVIVVGLALLGAARGAPGRERGRWWGLVLVGALVLALGPVLHWRGSPVFAWMPYRLLAELPLFGLMRLPHRWMLVVTLGLAVLAARGARDLPWLAAFFVWSESTLFLVPDRPTTDLTPPAVVAAIDGPVLDLPPRTIGVDARGRYLVWQRLHGQPVGYTLLMQAMGPRVAAEPLVQAVAGLDSRDSIVERLPEAAQFRQEEFARAAARWRHDRGDRESLVGAGERLRAMGFELVVLHLSLLDAEDAVEIGELLSLHLGAPALRTEEALLWRL